MGHHIVLLAADARDMAMCIGGRERRPLIRTRKRQGPQRFEQSRDS
jgi:hypothetical protein